jgi:hypothetical protein
MNSGSRRRSQARSRPGSSAVTIRPVPKGSLLPLTLAAAGCATQASAEGTVPAPLDPDAPRSPYIAFGKGPWEPVASADGRWSMEFVALNTENVPTPEGDRFLSASVRFRPDAGDALVLGPPALRLAAAADAEPRTDAKWTHVWFAATAVSLLAPIPVEMDRLGFAELRCRLMRVAEWRTAEVVVEREGQKSVVAAPFRFACTPDAMWLWVSASLDEDSFRDADKAETRALGHRWASTAADVTDARGAKLTAHGGGGSGGSSATMYCADEGNATLPVAYPVTVRLRVPARFDVEDVVFRLDGLALPRKAPPAAR